ncbi:hypothetical protein [Fibrella forsythiae]|uniref:Uncharacterized protein n=1 Tax=Fibrella forsythiae TaxID=2817061 RepID=A0ABS3JFP0_9BACT|nr:hypothetical protein [Fibrella forsythiae]MBO0947717.1 hypothetical protein [Fibrella forsythiae]
MNTQLLPRWLSILIGPELLWLLMYGLVVLLASANTPPGRLADDLFESLSIIIPVLTAAGFLLWYLPVVEKRWLLLRFWIAGVLGGHIVLATGMAAHSQQDPDGEKAYLAGMVLVVFVLLVGSLYVQIRFRSRSSNNHR